MRIQPDLSLETPLWQAGLRALAGLDEAGRGAWAGPVAAAAVVLPPEHLLIDAVRLTALPLPQTSLVRGDQRSLSIAAASVLAKTARDGRMQELDEQFPGYGFAAHKGYGTARHQRALDELGPCPQHRLSFAPLRARLPGAA